MITGHTRCLVDGLFGVFKQKYRRADVFSMAQLADVVAASTASNVPEVVASSSVVWREWDTFFPNYFRPVPGVSSYQHFEFNSATPGIVNVAKRVGDVFTPVNILKVPVSEVTNAGIPAVIVPGGHVAGETCIPAQRNPAIRPCRVPGRTLP